MRQRAPTPRRRPLTVTRRFAFEPAELAVAALAVPEVEPVARVGIEHANERLASIAAGSVIALGPH